MARRSAGATVNGRTKFRCSDRFLAGLADADSVTFHYNGWRKNCADFLPNRKIAKMACNCFFDEKAGWTVKEVQS